jgi:purine-binding chemotaxis protein CheW
MEERMANHDRMEEGDFDLQDSLENKYLSFYLDRILYGISVADVIEILKVVPTTPVPELPYYVKGIINLRGEVMPIVDVNLRFGRPEKEYTDRTCFIIVNVSGKSAGVVVDEVAEVITLEVENIKSPPLFNASGQDGYVTGVVKTQTGTLLVLDLRRILSESELGF